MSELPKPPVPMLVRIVNETRAEVRPFDVRNAMRPPDFAGFTEAGRDALAVVLRRTIERNRKAAT